MISYRQIFLLSCLSFLFIFAYFCLFSQHHWDQDHGMLEVTNGADGVQPNRLIRNPLYAYVCLCANVRAIYPTLVLFQQLINIYANNGEYVVLVLDNIPEELLSPFELFGVRIKKISQHPLFPLNYPVNNKLTKERDNILWHKLQLWELAEYEKIIALDNDLLLLHNFDELFEHSELSAVPMVFKEEKIVFWEPAGKVENETAIWNNMTKVQELHVNWTGLNGGVMVLAPNLDTYNGLLRAASSLQDRTCCPTQEFIFRYFEGIGKYTRLPPNYNLRKLHRLDHEIRSQYVDNVKIYHFVERMKPIILGKKNCINDGFATKWWIVADQVDRILDRWVDGNPALEENIRKIRREAIQPALS